MADDGERWFEGYEDDIYKYGGGGERSRVWAVR